jgi:hypothetical protein
MPAASETLNGTCACISVDREALQALLERGRGSGGLYASILANQPHLFASVPVFVGREHVDAMFAVIEAIERVVALDPFRDAALAVAPQIATIDHGPRGVFYGYDFHVGDAGPKLIEINTNAGGALLNAVLAQAQKACCVEMDALSEGPVALDAIEDRFVAMFREEWSLQRGAASLGTIAIVDSAPPAQYLYPEFLLFEAMFRSKGIEAIITAPEELRFDGHALLAGERRIDVVYNRLTDFYLESDAVRPLREAYLAGATVMTPHPRGHALYGDKRHLVTLSDAERLAALGADRSTIDTLLAGVPRTVLVTDENRDTLWAERKKYFFKTVAGYGGKAAYRGDKLTTSTWAEMSERAYVAQEVVRPSERTVVVEGKRVPLKLDVRVYVYDGAPQLLAARLYQGQTTNFRTTGGGFAPVFTDRQPWHRSTGR